MSFVRTARTLVGIVLCGFCMGSSCFGDDSGTSDDTGTTSSGPVLEVTVAGTHFGPYANDAGAFASLTTDRDTLGEIDSSTLQLHAVADGGMLSCDLTVQRFGMNIAGFAAAPYSLVDATDSTDDRSASLSGLIAVTVGTDGLSCSGDDCAALFVINVLDSAHVEGYLTATVQNPQDGTQSSLVVDFYLPWSTYDP